jgi:fumarate reductase subunit D
MKIADVASGSSSVMFKYFLIILSCLLFGYGMAIRYEIENHLIKIVVTIISFLVLFMGIIFSRKKMN